MCFHGRPKFNKMMEETGLVYKPGFNPVTLENNYGEAMAQVPVNFRYEKSVMQALIDLLSWHKGEGLRISESDLVRGFYWAGRNVSYPAAERAAKRIISLLKGVTLPEGFKPNPQIEWEDLTPARVLVAIKEYGYAGEEEAVAV